MPLVKELIDYQQFKENYKLIAIDLSKEQALNTDPKVIQQIDFSRNIDQTWNTAMFFILEKVKKAFCGFVLF